MVRIRNFASVLLILLSLCSLVYGESLDGKPYTPGEDPDIDMYISSWQQSVPFQSHGSLIERTILKRGKSIDPTKRGEVYDYMNRFSYAVLDIGASTLPTKLKGEQEVLYILSGKGTIEGGNKIQDLFRNIAVLVPADLDFQIHNTGDEPLTMYLVNEPIPAGFRPNDYILVKNENILPVVSTTGHWSHIDKTLFKIEDGLGTIEYVTTCGIAPMTIGHPHSHKKGTEETWAVITGNNILFLGKEIRRQGTGTAYMIPPDDSTPHSNINVTDDEELKFFYFARYRDHEVRK